MRIVRSRARCRKVPAAVMLGTSVPLRDGIPGATASATIGKLPSPSSRTVVRLAPVSASSRCVISLRVSELI